MISQRSAPLYDQFYLDKGEGEPIVLLHGLFGSLSNWTSVVDNLSKNYRVIIPRLPIFEVPQHQANLEKLTLVLDEFFDWHQLSDITLIGNSMGGHLALLYTLHKPHNVKRLILTGSSGLFENTLGATFPRVKDYAFIHKKVSYTFYNKEVVTKELVDEVYDTVQSIPKTLRLLGLARSAQQNNLSESLYKINQPVLLIWGLQDEITPPETALHFHDLLPHSDLKFIDHCGHVPMMEHPDLFNQYVNEFLKNQ